MWRHADVWQPFGQQRQYGQCCWGVNVRGGELLGALCLLPEPSLLEFRNGGYSQQHWQRWYIWAWMCSNPSNNYYILPIQHGCIMLYWTLFCWVSLGICTTIQAVQWSTSGLSFAPTGENRTTHYAWLTKIARHGAQPRCGNNMLRLRSVPSSSEISRIWSFEPDLIDDKRLIPSPVHRTNTPLEA